MPEKRTIEVWLCDQGHIHREEFAALECERKQQAKRRAARRKAMLEHEYIAMFFEAERATYKAVAEKHGMKLHKARKVISRAEIQIECWRRLGHAIGPREFSYVLEYERSTPAAFPGRTRPYRDYELHEDDTDLPIATWQDWTDPVARRNYKRKHLAAWFRKNPEFDTAEPELPDVMTPYGWAQPTIGRKQMRLKQLDRRIHRKAQRIICHARINRPADAAVVRAVLADYLRTMRRMGKPVARRQLSIMTASRLHLALPSP